MGSTVLRDGEVEGTAGDVLVPPLDNKDVAALLFDGVGHVVRSVSHVFDVDLLTGSLWPVDAHHQHVNTCRDENIRFKDRDHRSGAGGLCVAHLLGCSPP